MKILQTRRRRRSSARSGRLAFSNWLRRWAPTSSPNVRWLRSTNITLTSLSITNYVSTLTRWATAGSWTARWRPTTRERSKSLSQYLISSSRRLLDPRLRIHRWKTRLWRIVMKSNHLNHSIKSCSTQLQHVIQMNKLIPPRNELPSKVDRAVKRRLYDSTPIVTIDLSGCGFDLNY